MSNLAIIETKISSIQKYLERLGRYKKFSQEEIISDPDRQAALERYLYLAVQATIDLGEAVIAFKGFRRPGTYTEVFYILDEAGFIPKQLSEKLVNMAKFRNIVAHDYEAIDFGIMYGALKNRLTDIEEFIAVTKQNLNLSDNLPKHGADANER